MMSARKLSLPMIIMLFIASCGQQTETSSSLESRNPDNYAATHTKSACEIRNYARSAGFSENQLDMVVCIAYYESTFNPRPTSNLKYKGLMQINPELHGRKRNCDPEQLENPAKNLQCAYTVYKESGTFQPWHAYTALCSNSARYVKPLGNICSGNAGRAAQPDLAPAVEPVIVQAPVQKQSQSSAAGASNSDFNVNDIYNHVLTCTQGETHKITECSNQCRAQGNPTELCEAAMQRLFPN